MSFCLKRRNVGKNAYAGSGGTWNSVFGAGFAIRTGLPQDRLRIYVPAVQLEEARGVADELFSGNA